MTLGLQASATSLHGVQLRPKHPLCAYTLWGAAEALSTHCVPTHPGGGAAEALSTHCVPTCPGGGAAEAPEYPLCAYTPWQLTE